MKKTIYNFFLRFNAFLYSGSFLKVLIGLCVLLFDLFVAMYFIWPIHCQIEYLKSIRPEDWFLDFIFFMRSIEEKLGRGTAKYIPHTTATDVDAFVMILEREIVFYIIIFFSAILLGIYLITLVDKKKSHDREQ